MSKDFAPVGEAQFTVALRCPCGQEGTALFEGEQRGGAKPRATLAVSDGFYLRVTVRALSHPHIICNRCGTIQRQRPS